MNSLLKHGYILKLLTLKADAQYLLKMFGKKFMFQDNLEEVLKQHRQQDFKIAKRFYKQKTK